MNKRILLIGLVLVTMLIFTACNPHETSWNRERCYDMGLAYYSAGFDDTVICQDLETLELVYFDYRELEQNQEGNKNKPCLFEVVTQ